MRLLPAAALLLACPSLAWAQPADIPPEIDKVLVCSTVFSLRGTDARDAGDEGGYTEWSNRGAELEGRAALMLADAGFAADGIENIRMNYSVTVGFEVGLGMPRFSFEDCLVFVE